MVVAGRRLVGSQTEDFNRTPGPSPLSATKMTPAASRAATTRATLPPEAWSGHLFHTDQSTRPKRPLARRASLLTTPTALYRVIHPRKEDREKHHREDRRCPNEDESYRVGMQPSHCGNSLRPFRGVAVLEVAEDRSPASDFG
jgi:hypothetical protein